MKIITLISSVNKNIEQLVREMKVQTDCVVTCQCDHDAKGEYVNEGRRVVWECLSSRGVGINRNTCIKNTDCGDIILFSDEDIIYDENYALAIEEEYKRHPEADGILFNMRVGEERRTYWNEDYKRIRFYNYGRYPAYSISIRRDALEKSGVRFPLEFGGGARYINGEDSVFLHDLLAKKIKLYRSPICLGEETVRESTWFKGYNETFFISRGALYVRLYGKMAPVMARVFLLRHKYMTEELGFNQSIKLMKQGIKEMSSK